MDILFGKNSRCKGPAAEKRRMHSRNLWKSGVEVWALEGKWGEELEMSPACGKNSQNPVDFGLYAWGRVCRGGVGGWSH